LKPFQGFFRLASMRRLEVRMRGTKS